MFERRNDHTEEPMLLTAEGRARRRSMLSELLATQQRLIRRRRRRRGAGVAVMLLATAVAWNIVSDATPMVTGLRIDPPPASPRTRIISTSVRRGIVRTIGDDELLDLLDSIGRPSGLIRFGGRTILTSEALGAVHDTGEVPTTPAPAPLDGRDPDSMRNGLPDAGTTAASYDLASSCRVAGLFSRASC